MAASIRTSSARTTVRTISLRPMPDQPPRRRQVLGPPPLGWHSRPRHRRQLLRQVPPRRHPARREPMGFRAMLHPTAACIRIYLARTVSLLGLRPLRPRRRSLSHHTGYRPMPALTAVSIRYCSAQKTPRRGHRMGPRRLPLPDRPHRRPSKSRQARRARASCETYRAGRRVGAAVTGRAARNLLRSALARRGALKPTPLGHGAAGITP
jgi:hypothetical protein